MSDPLEPRIGEVLQRVAFPIEAGKVREFARAIGDASPVRHDVEAARSMGFAAVPAPPTFTTAIFHYLDTDYAHLSKLLGLDLSRLVHGEQAWTLRRPLLVGEVLDAVTTLDSVAARPARSGGVMRRVVVSTAYRDAAGEVTVTEAMTMVELPASA
jgi:acyl dehydratase